MIIKNARVFTGCSFEKQTIHFTDRITDIIPCSGNEQVCCSADDGSPNAADSQIPNAEDEQIEVTENEPVLDAGGCLLIPGLVDIHTHGAAGIDVSKTHGDGLARLSLYYAVNGVTSWCPTTLTLSEQQLTSALHVIRDFVRPENGAKVAGVHLEGPFLSHSHPGSQNPSFLQVPDIDLFARLCDASGDMIRLVSVAPEEPGALPFIRKASRVCTVSIGHTGADYATAMAAFEAGASHVTHLFNAMPPLHHRNPGVIGAAFDAGATAELITDGLHIHPSVIRIACRLFGERLVLISDSLSCTGLPEGEYELGGQPVILREDKATLAGTDTIAGSTISLLTGLRRAAQAGIPLASAILSATLIPAKVIGMDHEIGSISPGKRADLLLLDDDLNLKAVFIEGRLADGPRGQFLRPT